MTDQSTNSDLPENVPERDPDADVPGKRMSDDLRKRREQTWQMLVVEDRDYGEVCETLAAEYDVTRSAIEKDIERMDNWLPKLDKGSVKSGASRIRELRHNRKRRRELLQEVRNDPDASRQEELALLRQIDQAIQMDVQISQSLGLTEREPQEHVTKHEGTVNHELSDKQREHLSKLKAQARDQIPEREDTIRVDNLAESDADADDSGDGAEGGEPADGDVVESDA